MKQFRFNVDDRFYQELHDRLETSRSEVFEHLSRAEQARQQSGWRPILPHLLKQSYQPYSIPTAEHLKNLVETVFWSSLRRDEGRDLRFSLSYQPWRPFEPSTSRIGFALFKTPIRLEVTSLSRMAPSVSPDLSVLVAGDQNGELVILGLDAPQQLEIAAIDPGLIVVKYGGINVGFVRSGVASYNPEPYSSGASSVWAKAGWQSTKRATYRDIKIDVIVAALRAVRDLQHGGALIVVPGQQSCDGTVECRYTCAPRESNSVRKAVADYERTIGVDEEGLAYASARLHETAVQLARLSGVDGATIVTRDLDVVGFGVRLKPRPTQVKGEVGVWRVNVLENSGRPMRATLAEIGNTRHQAAAQFVVDNPESIAFVVSQDGGVTGFVWETEPPLGPACLYAYLHLELTML